MTTTIMQAVADAKSALTPLTPGELKPMLGSDNVLIVDVRDPAEVVDTGKIPGAIVIPRGMLEFHACDTTPMHNQAFSKDKTIVLYCASGGRAALAGKSLKDLGYSDVRFLGSLKNWADAGGRVETL